MNNPKRIQIGFNWERRIEITTNIALILIKKNFLFLRKVTKD